MIGAPPADEPHAVRKPSRVRGYETEGRAAGPRPELAGGWRLALPHPPDTPSVEVDMPNSKLVEYLDQNDVRYVTQRHSKAFTAQEVAAAAHVPGRELAKPVMVKLDGRLSMAVLPASHQVQLERLARETGASQAELAEEKEFEGVFPETELGAMPPFGNLYGVPVFVDPSLEEDEEIAFSAGTHSEVVRMSYEDYRRLVGPQVKRFGRKA